MPRYAVETLTNFVEIHFVEAENEEQAKKIALESDYNASKWLGTQVVDVSEYTEESYKRAQRLDSYVFEGYSAINENGYLVYYRPDGTLNGSMPETKIEL